MEETTTASAPSLSTTYSAPRVALLTNFVPPYRVPVFKALQDRLGSLSILISTPMEDDRPWPPDFSDLDVTVQKSLTLHHRPRHPHGFRDDLSMHIPYDSLMRLQRLQPGVIITA